MHRAPAEASPPGLAAAAARAPERFAEAARRVGVQERAIGIAGLHVRLEFAGPAMVPQVFRSLAHLATAPGAAPDLVVRVWDAASTGTPSPPLALDAPVERGPAYLIRGPDVRAMAHGASRSLSSLAAEVGYHWAHDAQRVPYWEAAVPLRNLFHWWLATRGLLLVHAGAVGTDEGGVLLAGRGGAGKSTTALACLLDGMAYCGDDYVVVAAAPDPVAHPLYGTAKLKPDDRALLPRVLHAVDNGDRLPQEKAVIFVNERFPERILEGLPLRAMVLPRVTEGPEPVLRPVSAGRALVGLAPSTIMQLAGERQEALSAMAGVVGRLPAFELETGSDAGALPAAVRRAIRRAGEAS